MKSNEDSLELRVVLKGSHVERFKRIQEKLGISSRADVLRHLITIYPLPPPRFEHINTYQNHAMIKDYVLNRQVDIHFRENGGAFCDLCNLEDCHHIDYIRSLQKKERFSDSFHTRSS